MYRYIGLTEYKSVCNNDKVILVSNMSVFWQIIQYFLTGVSEIFAIIAGLEFFFSQSPKSMRSVIQAFNLFTTAMGSWINTLLVIIFKAWIPDNLNHGKLEWFYIVLAALMFINCFFFRISAKKYNFKSTEIESMEDQSINRKLSIMENVALRPSIV